MKALASISAVLCITVVAAIAAPRSTDWWGAQAHRAAISVPSHPAEYRSGFVGDDGSAGQARGAHAD